MRLFVFAILALSLAVLFGCSSAPPAVNDTANLTNQTVDQTCSGPVCGIDGKAYPTDCEAAKANVTIAYAGDCKAVQPLCEDSDGGMKPDTPGTVSLGDRNSSDSCISQSDLEEFFCDSGQIANLTIPCGGGKKCDSGACVPYTAPPAQNQTNTTIPSGCIGPPVSDTSVSGNVSNNGTIFKDVCVDFKTVKDYFCQEGSLKSENHECEPGYGCNLGRCELQLPICTDSDNGNDTSVRGTTMVVKGMATIFKETDSCLDQGTITEYACLANNSASTEEIRCQSGTKCFDGRCIRSKCSETDDGIDITHKGETTSIVSGSKVTETDTCADPKNIREYYCYGDEIRDDVLSCGKGYYCDFELDRCQLGSE
jgi:hypothetical protein